MERVEYGGWRNCIRLANGTVDLVATTDVGPRIIRFGFEGKENELHEDLAQMGRPAGPIGWIRRASSVARPGIQAEDLLPGQHPVKYETDGVTLRLIQDVEPTTGMRKEIDVDLDAKGSHARLTHKITNTNLWAVELAPWALTVMHKGGKAIFPQEPYSPHPDIPDEPGQKIDPKYYLPSRNLIMWSYTKLNDPRWLFTAKYIILKQDEKATRPQKIGMSNQQDWELTPEAASLCKESSLSARKTYPDNGCNFETFTNADMLELESLGPVVKLAPGATVTHVEDWYLLDNVNFDDTDDSIDANVLPKVKSVI